MKQGRVALTLLQELDGPEQLLSPVSLVSPVSPVSPG